MGPENGNAWTTFIVGNERFRIRQSGPVIRLSGSGSVSDVPSYGRRLSRLAGEDSMPFRELVGCDQVHGASLAVIGPKDAGVPAGLVGAVDGLITARPGLGLCIRTADCVPVLIDGGVRGVGAVHAGWRGVSRGIVAAAIRCMRESLGLFPAELRVTLGPSIGACHYEVGDEVIEALRTIGVPDGHWRRAQSVDLRELIRRQLLGLGVSDRAIEVVGPCTFCDPTLESFRRDGARAGRQLSIIGRSV